LCEINHVADEDLNGHFTPVTLIDPLFDLLEARSLGDVEHEEDSCGTINVLVNVLVVPLLAWHVEVDDLVLVSIVDVIGSLDVQFCRLFILHDSSESLRNCIQEGGLANARVPDESNLEPEMVVVDLAAGQLLLLLE
jgi:hypothetical protein